MTKVAVVGAGMVGATTAYSIISKGLVQELGLIDANPDRAMGEAMDLKHCLAFTDPVDIRAGGYELCKDAQIVIVTAGAAQKEGETRLDLCAKNSRIMRSIVREVMAHNPYPILLIVSNPVDVLTRAALEESGLPPERVIGSGTVLDTARFRFLIANHCRVDVRNVHGYVIGEHGDSEVFVWSRLNIGGVAFDQYCRDFCARAACGGVREEIEQDVRNSAYQIIQMKGATYYAVSLAVARIVKSILRNQRSVLTVSTQMRGQFGLQDVCLSLPCLVGSAGVEAVIDSPLGESEEAALLRSARTLKEAFDAIEP
ncbi:MAG: L-lactate dehydrogenase [Desulfovibrionaceae bacterium]